jgi:hypothetical protein
LQTEQALDTLKVYCTEKGIKVHKTALKDEILKRIQEHEDEEDASTLQALDAAARAVESKLKQKEG